MNNDWLNKKKCNRKWKRFEILRSGYGTSFLMKDDNMDCGAWTCNLQNDVLTTKAENLGEIDDVAYFKNKLFSALNFPKDNP